MYSFTHMYVPWIKPNVKPNTREQLIKPNVMQRSNEPN